MIDLSLTRRRLLQAGGLVMVSSLLPLTRATAAGPTPPSAVPAAQYLDTFIALSADGNVTAFNGHVDLGTGVRTALAQYVADELDVEFSAITMILGDTSLTPDQGPTIASSTLQVSAVPLRQAAAQVRDQLMSLAAKVLNVPVSALRSEKGMIFIADRPQQRLSYGQLVKGEDYHQPLDPHQSLKPAVRRYVGQPVPRVDIPAKVSGELTWVHDLRLPGMLHGRVIRPPYAGADSSAPLGNALISVDKKSVAHLPGIISVVVINDFIGVVAEREEQAIAAMYALKVTWKTWTGLPDLSLENLHQTLSDWPKQPRMLQEDPGVDQALEQCDKRIDADYIWPYHMHASIGPSCAVADVQDGQAVIWSGTQNPHDLRNDLALLLEQPVGQIEVKRMEASGCYGRNCADDVAADAALLSRATGRPVRVQLMREQESAWEPKGTAQLIRVRGGLNREGNVAAWEFRTCYPSNNAVTLPLVLSGKVANQPNVQSMGDRTAIPAYRYPHMRAICEDAAPIVRASWMRGVSALPNVFAHESWIDEAAWIAGQDPIDYRLSYLDDPRALALIEAIKKQSNWQTGPMHQRQQQGELLQGRGFAWARYIHSKFPGFGAAWAAWVCDLTLNRHSGEIVLNKLYVAHDCGQMVNPAGVRHQVHGNIIQSCSRILKEAVTFNSHSTTSLEWGSYPLLRFDELPEVDIQLLDYPDKPPMGAGESASVPSAAAIANALFDATGVRFRAPPFTPERVLDVLQRNKA